MKILYSLLLCLSMLFSGCAAKQPVKPQPKIRAELPIQLRASHLLQYKDKEDETDTFCTGTVVGPHAVMTAFHCNKGKYSTFSMDLATQEYHIVGYAADGRDHIIYLVDGPAFSDISVIKERAAKVGESVYFYGCGGAKFPPVLKSGSVNPSYDPSELDARAEIEYLNIPAIPGDSGSAVYANDGSIIGLITYRSVDGKRVSSVGFALNFAPEVLAQAAQSEIASQQ